MDIDISKIKRALDKLRKKDTILFKAVQNKINQIASLDKTSIQHFKNLKYGLSNYKRVHIGSFVLIFNIHNNVLIFESLLHHDQAY